MDMDDDTELVGIKTQKEDMIKFCKEPSNGRRGNRVIAVVGMGGLGKTTLVREVYKEAWKDFESFAWIAVSRSNFNRLDILKSIYKQFLETPGHVNDKLQQVLKFGDIDSVTKDLRDHLEQNRSMRYLVVLDDVWDGSEQLVTDMKAALPIHLNDGSRILLTTRNEDVAKHWTTILGGRMYEQLQPLPFDKAWSLFCKKLFGENNCPRDLEELSYEIVMKCDGLPLAIVAVAGLLSTKRKVVSEWRQVHDRLSSEFGSNSLLLRCTRRILLLSYQELPYHLKPCFLYFGLFPEDYSIQGMRLVRLWIAEGFIPHARDKTVEEVAQEYLVALVKRNLVQVSQRDSTGRSRSFHIHDLFREVIHSKLEEIGFSKVLSKDNNNNNNNNNSPGLSHFRRLSIHDSSLVKKNKTTGNIHSVLSFDGQNQTALPSWLDTQPKYLRYLKILDLQDAPIYHIPENSGDLYHLQYLSLRNTKVTKLPNSIGKLVNLQTLDIKQTRVSELPREINQLHKLRHLLAYVYDPFKFPFCVETTKIPDGFLRNLEELQKLAFVDAGSSSSLLYELRNVKQLKRLGITRLKRQDARALCDAVKEMKVLKALLIYAVGRDEFLDLKFLKEAPDCLERLSLTGCLEALPYWITDLRSLSKLTLRCSRLQDDPAKMLQGLPNLVSLELYQTYDGQMLDFGNNGFPNLKVLNLYHLYHLKFIIGALPLLQHVRCSTCPKLQDLPPHINRRIAQGHIIHEVHVW